MLKLLRFLLGSKKQPVPVLAQERRLMTYHLGIDETVLGKYAERDCFRRNKQ